MHLPYQKPLTGSEVEHLGVGRLVRNTDVDYELLKRTSDFTEIVF